MQKVGLNALMPDIGQLSAAWKGEAAEQMKQGIGSFAQKMFGSQAAQN